MLFDVSNREMTMKKVNRNVQKQNHSSADKRIARDVKAGNRSSSHSEGESEQTVRQAGNSQECNNCLQNQQHTVSSSDPRVLRRLEFPFAAQDLDREDNDSSTSNLGLRISQAHQSNNHNACSTCHVSDNKLSNSDYRKKRMGIFKNLRRKLSSLSIRKSESEETESYGHISDHTPQNIIQDSVSSRSNSRLSLQGHASDYAAGQSDCCSSSPLKSYMSPKFSEWHSNTDHCDMEHAKDKPGCFSKDISKFNPTLSLGKGGEYPKSDIVGDRATNSTSLNIFKNDDKPCRPEPAYELADCVEYDPVKEQTRIWSPKVWSLTQELFRLSKFGWYWGPITRIEAEDKLINQPDGAFLVRDSSDERYLLSLSFRSFGRTLHTRIEHCNGMFSFYAQIDTEGYPSIVELIERSMNDSLTGIFYYSRSRSPEADQIPVRLTKPVSRFTQVQSLQHMCRFVIRQYTRYDHIQLLPLPNSLKGWIEENQYWTVS